jgi:hypothetical protein
MSEGFASFPLTAEEHAKLPQSTVPCPFCHGAELHTHASRTGLPADDPHGSWFIVICMGCGATGPRAWKAQEAVDLWEQRRVA